jgi:hypothetical protein
MFRQRFPRDVLYADAHPFYIKGFFEKDVAPIIMKKHLIICTNAHTIATQRSKFESIFKIQAWVETPVTNSFSVLGVVYDRVMDEYSQLIEKGLSAQDVVVLVSSGPMGKVLAFQCSKNGIQCLDIGHGFETFYTDDMRLQNALI